MPVTSNDTRRAPASTRTTIQKAAGSANVASVLLLNGVAGVLLEGLLVVLVEVGSAM